MPTDLLIDWNASIEIDGVDYCPDHLERARYAQFLTEFLSHQDQSKPYVLNLNSGWGTGKTYFLKRWTEDLKKRHPVVYIDAWRDDHSDDPFMTVISSIISQLRSKTSYAEENPFIKGLSKSLTLFKAIGPLMVGAAAKKYLGKDMSELAEMLDGESTDLGKDVGDAASKMAQFLISSHDQKSESVKVLKQSIIDWINSIIGHNTEIIGPTFIIIDELDRCRPSYAVETLEAVKHIFDIPGVFFIIATDTEQLQHAIKVVYGNGFDAHTYLSRFFDSRFSLRETPLIHFIEAHCQVELFTREYGRRNDITLWPICESPLDNVVTILDSFKLQPRSAIQVIHKLSSVIIYLKPGSVIDIAFLTILHCLKMSDPDTYNKVLGRAHLGRISDFFSKRDYFSSGLNLKVMESITTDKNILNVSLKKYYLTVLNFICDVFLMEGDCSGLTNGSEFNIRAEIFKKMENSRESITDVSYHMMVIQYEYIASKLIDKNKSYYKDLVELSASFD